MDVSVAKQLLPTSRIPVPPYPPLLCRPVDDSEPSKMNLRAVLSLEHLFVTFLVLFIGYAVMITVFVAEVLLGRTDGQFQKDTIGERPTEQTSRAAESKSNPDDAATSKL